jgi:ketosteroid isomerase-like protein
VAGVSTAAMSTEQNRRIIAQAFDGLSRADPTAFLDAMADDIIWIIEGQSKLSRRYEGKNAIETELVPTLFANFATPYRTIPEEIIAERDRIVVLARGEVKTVRGEDYNNSYCFVIRMRGGKIVELREYMDTALAERVLRME